MLQLVSFSQSLSPLGAPFLTFAEKFSARFIFFFNFIFSFSYFWLLWVFAGVLQLWPAGVSLAHGAGASHCSGFSHCGARAAGGTWAWYWHFTGSSPRAKGLWQRGSVAPRHVGSSGSGMELLSPGLQGRFLTAGPPERPLSAYFLLSSTSKIFGGLPWQLSW